MAVISTSASGAELGPALTLVSAPCTTGLMDELDFQQVGVWLYVPLNGSLFHEMLIMP